MPITWLMLIALIPFLVAGIGGITFSIVLSAGQPIFALICFLWGIIGWFNAIPLIGKIYRSIAAQKKIISHLEDIHEQSRNSR